MSQDEIGRIGYEFMDVKDALARYPVLEMEDGWQEMEDGEEIYVVKAPALGLWRVMRVGTSGEGGQAGSHGTARPPAPLCGLYPQAMKRRGCFSLQ